jgi:hypothetical protein
VAEGEREVNDERTACPKCGEPIRPRGFGLHVKARATSHEIDLVLVKGAHECVRVRLSKT